MDGRAVRILLPGDDGYEAAMGAPPDADTPASVPDFNAAVRTVSRAANPGAPSTGPG